MSLRQQITIPSTLYCGFQQRTSQDDVPLGFVVPDGTDEAATKRKSTVDNWALRGNVYYDHTTGQTLTRQGLSSVSFPNELLTGFKVSRSIKRSGWHGTNTVVRVEDPRGFELEISVDNFIQIMNGNLVDDGEILCRCIWGRVGQKNILLTENSQPYQEAIVNTERHNTDVAIGSVKLGQKVLMKVGFTGIYLGQQNVLSQDYNYSEFSGYKLGSISGESHYIRISSTGFAFESKKAHFFYDDVNNVLMQVTTPKLSRIVDQTTITETDAENRLNEIILARTAKLVDGNNKSTYRGIDAWSGNTLAKRPRKTEYRIVRTTEAEFLKLPGNPLCVLEYNGNFYRVRKEAFVSGDQDTTSITASKLDRKMLDDGKVVDSYEEKMEYNVKRPVYRLYVPTPSIPRNEATFYHLEMEYKSPTTNITRIAYL